MRSARTWARSYCACCVSQPSALPPKTLDNRTAISGETPRLPFTSSDGVVRVTPRAAAASVIVRPKGSMHCRSTRRGAVDSSLACSISFSGNRLNQRPMHLARQSERSLASSPERSPPQNLSTRLSADVTEDPANPYRQPWRQHLDAQECHAAFPHAS